MATLQDVLKAYGAAWGMPDKAERDRLLAQGFAEGGVYVDPTVEARGRAALSDHIGATLAQFPGARIELTTGIDSHHDLVRFGWRFVLENGTVPVAGVDFCRLGADGLLTEVNGFFGDLPAA